MRLKKNLRIRMVFLIILAVVLLSSTYAGSKPPGPGQAKSVGRFSDPNGALKQVQTIGPGVYYNASDRATNHTITFDVLGIEQSNPTSGIIFNVTTTGTITVNFIGSKPKVICSLCTSSYNGVKETIGYSGGLTDQLILIWSSVFGTPESKKVLFYDDFLNPTPIVDSFWTIDQYAASPNSAGEFTSGGFLAMYSLSTSSQETVHVTNPIYNPLSYTSGTAVKRKMTVSLYPFEKSESSATASIRTGLDSFITSGAFPGSNPANTPFTDSNNNCVSTGGIQDSIGTSYISMNNVGTVLVATCGDGGNNKVNLITGLDPTKYTVFTIQTFGIFCSTCLDKVYASTAWTFFRVYQEDASNNILAATDVNINFTSNIAPLFQNAYVFVSQQNSNGASTNQRSWIDLVQVQNYGSPVCLFGCIPPFDIPTNAFSSVWATLVSFCQWIGFGDLGLGAFFLFGILESMTLASTYFVMNRFEGASTLVLIIEFVAIEGIFLTSGLMGSIWIFAFLTVDVIAALLTFRSIFFAGSRGGSVEG